jgi:hypothetical protein
LPACINSGAENSMQISRALLKNTRASLRFHKRLIIFLVALLAITVGLVLFTNSLTSNLGAAGERAGSAGVTPMPTMDEQAMDSGSGDNYYYTSDTTHTHPTSTPTSTPTGPSPTDDVIHFSDPLPEYGWGGALVALFAGFVAFTIFVRRNKAPKVA